MRGMTTLALTTAAMALLGCATPAPSDVAWSVSENRIEGLKLVLGIPDSDDLRLMMICRPQSGRVALTIVGRLDDPAVAELWSGKLSQRIAGAGHLDEEIEGAMDIQFQLSADEPVLRRFADTGELMVRIARRRIVLPNGFAPAHDFLTACQASGG